ncbi:MAG: SCO family protein [Myxococcales bacterium]
MSGSRTSCSLAVRACVPCSRPSSLRCKSSSGRSRCGSCRFSVDPEYDTPQVLSAYAARFEADPVRWQFLTGPLQDIERTVVQGFKVHRGDPEPSPADPNLVEIMHGEHFVLVDAHGDIRGYYRSDKAGLKELENDLRELLQ